MAGISGKAGAQPMLSNIITRAVETKVVAAQGVELLLQGFPAAYDYGFGF